MNADRNEKLRRFSAARIVEHQLNAVIFLVLVVTGLSQRFHDAALAQWVIQHIGGVDTARMVHRYSGLVFTLLCAVHVIVAAGGVLLKRFAPSMVITLDDFKDAIENLKYYFGIVNRPAACGRYDYKQKFEYWGVVVGGMLMIATGLILWFPVVATRFLPGEMIPAAKAAHTNEAVLAFLVIIVWHIYNSIFSPEVFPLDTAIFTGSISRERMVHEHPRELADREGKTLAEVLDHDQDSTYEVTSHE
jgi:formate dehydrogenase gamma subunit